MKLSIEFNKLAEYFDTPGRESPHAIRTNHSIEQILRKYKVKTVLDLACGTGSQAFYLAKRGYEVTGADISLDLVRIASSKARKEKMRMKMLHGDMRDIKVGSFDAIITIFNAVGFLTKKGFEKAMRNIHSNLNNNGLYVFDIFNVKCKENWTDAWSETRIFPNIRLHKVQRCKLDRKTGLLWSCDVFTVQKGSNKPEIFKQRYALQGYTAEDLRAMLNRNGFKTLGQYDIDGSKFLDKKSGSILTVARKQLL